MNLTANSYRGSIQLTHDHPTEKGSISVLIVGNKDSIVGNHEVTIDGKIYTVSKEWIARRVLARMLETEFNSALYDDDFSAPDLGDEETIDAQMRRLAESAIRWLASEDTDFEEAMEDLGLPLGKLKSPLWNSIPALFPGCEFHVDHDIDKTAKFSLASVKTIYR